MAQRTVALCNGKYIGIETIFTVVNGRQINIPGKLKELRAKSRNNELFCPCGCGANLILVAGDKNLREQHFRIKDADIYKDCHMVTEGKTSVDSKIVLKCWLDDNLHTDDLETRVPIYAVSDSSRKYEFSFISRKKGIALNYCHDRANLSEEKLQILEDNSAGICIIHIVDSLNGGSDGQYPEGLMKVQHRQRYCLLLSVENSDYEKAYLRAVFYEKDIDGLWNEICFAKGRLTEYRISADGSISFRGNPLRALFGAERQRFFEQLDAKRLARESDERQRVARLKQLQIDADKRRDEQRKKQEALDKRLAEKEKERQIKLEKEREARQRREEDFKKNLAFKLDQQETQVRDSEGNRWIKCEYCGKMAVDSEFSSYGGPIGIHLNLGTCKECLAKNPAVKAPRIEGNKAVKKIYDSTVCPECGGKLTEKNGRNGRFIGCTNYPVCRYTRSIRK